jgi:UDP-2-acetamido-3-amino-2,3-dideoxy-glucuronate N-acetyltransferase
MKHISPRARIASSALIDESVYVYGAAIIDEFALVEPFCIIGHPCQSEIDKIHGGQHSSMADLFEKASKSVCHIERSAIIRSSSVVYDDVRLGAHCEVGHGSIIREGVRIGPYCRLLPLTSIRRDASIGRGCRIAGIVSDRSQIEDYASSMGSLVHEYTIGVGGVNEAAPTIEVGATVGRGALVIGAVRVGQFALVGGGSVVRGDVEPFAIVTGDPARVVGRRSEGEIARLRERIAEGRWA